MSTRQEYLQYIEEHVSILNRQTGQRLTVDFTQDGLCVGLCKGRPNRPGYRMVSDYYMTLDAMCIYLDGMLRALRMVQPQY